MDYEITIVADDKEEIDEQIYRDLLYQLLVWCLSEGDNNEKSHHIYESID